MASCAMSPNGQKLRHTAEDGKRQIGRMECFIFPCLPGCE
jgi:hypothetical protein